MQELKRTSGTSASPQPGRASLDLRRENAELRQQLLQRKHAYAAHRRTLAARSGSAPPLWDLPHLPPNRSPERSLVAALGTRSPTLRASSRTVLPALDAK